MQTTDLRYPIGRFTLPAADPAELARLVDEIEVAPRRLREALAGMDDARLDTPYRDGGWTVRQVAHHVADSHMNAYVRMRLALTEDAPRIAPYDEAAWARLPDTRLHPEVSLALVDALHVRWVAMLRGVEGDAWERTYEHPENGTTTMRAALGIYAWHGKHHVAHVTGLRERMGW